MRRQTMRRQTMRRQTMRRQTMRRQCVATKEGAAIEECAAIKGCATPVITLCNSLITIAGTVETCETGSHAAPLDVSESLAGSCQAWQSLASISWWFAEAGPIGQVMRLVRGGCSATRRTLAFKGLARSGEPC
jgi:hypothetical protein